jgi:hypothetical protein
MLVSPDESSRAGPAGHWREPVGGKVESGSGTYPFWFTQSVQGTAPAEAAMTWKLGNRSGVHCIYAWIPRHQVYLHGQQKDDAPRAEYALRNGGGAWQQLGIVNQEAHGDVFVLLGQPVLRPNAEVRLTDNVGTGTRGQFWVTFSVLAAVPT